MKGDLCSECNEDYELNGNVCSKSLGSMTALQG